MLEIKFMLMGWLDGFVPGVAVEYSGQSDISPSVHPD